MAPITARSDSDDGNITVASYVLGTIGTVLWCIQLIPQIWYNWRQKKTDGFPPLMMLLWASSAQGSFDILGGIMYILVVVLEAGIYASHIIWRIRYRAVRKEARASGKSIDEVLEEQNRVQTNQETKKDGIISHHRGNSSHVQQQ
ncbi:hypothetical protein CBS147343_10058 [Aspergillus niger]|nr:hypothetical protein CBS11350_9750 [Aspergillus niger]KAI2857114.1 hypothetical protein CBS12448_6692 [Aspergillus niger]KAI2919658.1 hypothetical protein CBS147371_3647 [Aspergillus niger]KAI2938573.1 hypothetical protein CBS147321_7322 [Aspergillus niger]KAI2972953.1 hypothetical protein CBS147324_4335 [Aspergillus niger]